jgi:hypothetical protein
MELRGGVSAPAAGRIVRFRNGVYSPDDLDSPVAPLAVAHSTPISPNAHSADSTEATSPGSDSPNAAPSPGGTASRMRQVGLSRVTPTPLHPAAAVSSTASQSASPAPTPGDTRSPIPLFGLPQSSTTSLPAPLAVSSPRSDSPNAAPTPDGTASRMRHFGLSGLPHTHLHPAAAVSSPPSQSPSPAPTPGGHGPQPGQPTPCVSPPRLKTRRLPTRQELPVLAGDRRPWRRRRCRRPCIKKHRLPARSKMKPPNRTGKPGETNSAGCPRSDETG